MAEFLDTAGINNELTKMLKNAHERIIIVCPYLQVCDTFKEYINDKDREKIEIRFVFGKSDLQPAESDWLNSLDYARVSFCKNLHAKCYLNESVAIISSMNLYEFSQINNEEMGIIVSREEDPKLYTDISEEVGRLIRKSDDVKVEVRKLTLAEIAAKNARAFCIRCGTPIALNVKQPYCEKCFKSWNRFKDTEYVEKKGVCLLCGKPNESSFGKPACKDCFLKNRALFDN